MSSFQRVPTASSSLSTNSSANASNVGGLAAGSQGYLARPFSSEIIPSVFYFPGGRFLPKNVNPTGSNGKGMIGLKEVKVSGSSLYFFHICRYFSHIFTP